MQMRLADSCVFFRYPDRRHCRGTIYLVPSRPPAAVTSALESGLSLGTISFHSVLRNTIIIIAHDARVM